MAVTKLKAEMEKNKSNPYIQVVGQFLLDYIDQHPQDAEKITGTDKTITKSLNEMKKAAEKKKVGNCAVLTDQEGFEVVLKYFGVDPKPEVKPKIEAPSSITKSASSLAHKASADFDIKLEDLL